MLGTPRSTYAGHDLGAENRAVLATLIETCKLHAVNPEAYLADVLTRIGTTKSTRLPNPCPSCLVPALGGGD